MRQNKVVARAPKRLAERFHQVRTGHCRTGQYMEWTKNAGTAKCGWCQYKTQSRNHLFKNRKQWKMQQKILWAEVRKATGRGKNRFTIRDLLADERCTRSVMDFLGTTKVGRRAGPRAVPPKPGEDRVGEGPREDEGGWEESAEGEGRWWEHSLVSFRVRFACLFWGAVPCCHTLFCFLKLRVWERPGGGRGSYHGPPADCSKSRRTVNGKGLYIISP